MDDLIVGALTLSFVSLVIYKLTKLCIKKMDQITQDTKTQNIKLLHVIEEISHVHKHASQASVKHASVKHKNKNTPPQ